MKIIFNLIAVLLFVASAPGFAENSYASGTGNASQERMEYQKQTGQGPMEQERHREKEHKEVGKETGKGPEQGQPERQKQEKKWWKFWE